MSQNDWRAVSLIFHTLYVTPMVIGVKGSNFYLIRAFDMTAIEQYVSREFSTNQKEAAGAE